MTETHYLYACKYNTAKAGKFFLKQLLVVLTARFFIFLNKKLLWPAKIQLL